MANERIDILLVEDNPYDCELTLRVLRKHVPGSRIEVLRDGAGALSFLLGDDSHPGVDAVVMPRLVLLDLNLPKLNGIEVLAKLRADPRTEQLAIVLMTTSGEDRDVERAQQAGASSYVVKPLEYAEFVAVLRQVALRWVGTEGGRS